MHCLHPTTPPPLPSPSKQKVEIAEFTVIGIGGGGVGGWTQDNNFWELFWDHGLKQMAE